MALSLAASLALGSSGCDSELFGNCGDGAVQGAESCDDGNRVDGDGCSSNCLLEQGCGDGVLDPGEICDDGIDNDDHAPDRCRTTCEPARCGDGVIDGGEECDGYAVPVDATCEMRGHTGGPLSCVDCVLSTTSCEICGNGSCANKETAEDCPTDCKIMSIDARAHHTCAVVGASARCWGDNFYGQLGGPSVSADYGETPVLVIGLDTGVVDLDMGINHGCAVRSGGTAWCWGYDSTGAIGDGERNNSLEYATEVVSLTGVKTVAAGGGHSCALVEGGHVYCWGNNEDKQLGDSGVESSSKPMLIEGLGEIVSVGAGGAHNCVVDAGGAVKCWGNNWFAQLGEEGSPQSGVPVEVTALTNTTQLAAGNDHNCALDAGAIRCWGRNWNGQLGASHPKYSATPLTVEGLTEPTAVATGSEHSCALLADGTVRCWGYNASGQLGDGTKTSSGGAAVQVQGLDDAFAITAGGAHSCALRSNGVVVCWGSNYKGQLGNGSKVDSTVPVPVAL